jgi:hypothetical protein
MLRKIGTRPATGQLASTLSECPKNIIDSALKVYELNPRVVASSRLDDVRAWHRAIRVCHPVSPPCLCPGSDFPAMIPFLHARQAKADFTIPPSESSIPSL